jgi:hypothetical protein
MEHGGRLFFRSCADNDHGGVVARAHHMGQPDPCMRDLAFSGCTADLDYELVQLSQA